VAALLGKEGRIRVLAGLALSSQTVGSFLLSLPARWKIILSIYFFVFESNHTNTADSSTKKAKSDTGKKKLKTALQIILYSGSCTTASSLLFVSKWPSI